MIEIQLEQGSQEWLDFRRLHRMASETPAILGVSPYQKPSAVKRSKLHGSTQFVNNAMRRGTELEPVVRDLYCQQYEFMRPAVLVEGEYGASLDGINLDGSGIFECKVPVDGRESERWKLASINELTDYDYAQVQHQLMVSGAKWCHFCVWDDEDQQFMLADVKPNPEYWEKICAAWDQFWLEEIAL